MKLWIECAYRWTPVLNGVWRTCGSKRSFCLSVLLTAIQRRRIYVDKNLYGVSAQVIAPGVLVFRQILAEL